MTNSIQTGLSHEHNLFFLAAGEEVLVYEPQFPHQHLRASPLLTIHLPVSRGGLRGYINPLAPHCVNTLLVGYLGSDEILLTASDDGDVIGYSTSTIRSTIELQVGSLALGDSAQTQPRPFFIRNFRKSAWGLAIHAQARKIAVSANTHEVTVIAFALSEDGRGVSVLPERYAPTSRLLIF
jgi:hypothetical protein